MAHRFGQLGTVYARETMLVNEAKIVREIILSRVTKDGITLAGLEKTVMRDCREKKVYPLGGNYFRERVERLVHSGVLVKLLMRSYNLYFPAVPIPGVDLNKFDLSTTIGRQVCADHVQEFGLDYIAESLRNATKGSINVKARIKVSQKKTLTTHPPSGSPMYVVIYTVMVDGEQKLSTDNKNVAIRAKDQWRQILINREAEEKKSNWKHEMTSEDTVPTKKKK